MRAFATLLLLAASGLALAEAPLAGTYKGMRELPGGALRANPRPHMMWVTLDIRSVEGDQVAGTWKMQGGNCPGEYPFSGVLSGTRLIADFKGEGSCPTVKRIGFDVTPAALIWHPQGEEVRLTR
jgi:hypothetical protein